MHYDIVYTTRDYNPPAPPTTEELFFFLSHDIEDIQREITSPVIETKAITLYLNQINRIKKDLDGRCMRNTNSRERIYNELSEKLSKLQSYAISLQAEIEKL